MDVMWGETSGVEGQLWACLCPTLLYNQLLGCEAYIELLFTRLLLVLFSSGRQLLVCGAMLVLMAVGNFANTVETLMVKSRFKTMKRSRSKQDLDLPTPPAHSR
ncbi:hypothetical protein KSP40_PGU021386 [Platanthera guangdongensis]|uniref:Uncharacterized protein n=1 Tax=Platanthera guangdongensis TaxID=2320717 RepID=A0ABR2LMY2_9ASPA